MASLKTFCPNGVDNLSPESTEIFNLNFQSLQVVSRCYRDPQKQGTENVCDLRNLGPNIYQCFKIENIFYFQQLVIQVLVKHGTSIVVDISVQRVKLFY